jgi:hypothetical protein
MSGFVSQFVGLELTHTLYRSRFFVPAGTPARTPAVAFPVIAMLTFAGVALRFIDRYSAATPATWGEAIEVPLRRAVALGSPSHAEVISTPGAAMSTQDPELEK